MRLEAKGLASARGGRRLFDGLGFTLAGGEGLLLEGPNGSGKTTLLRMIAGLLPPDAGRITLDGGDAEQSIAEQAHYAGHKDAVKPVLTVEENLRFWADYLEGGRIEVALGAFGLEAIAHLPAQFLSAGQRRKLSLSRLVLARRPLWLLDEPSVSLDGEARGALAAMMRRHLEAGGLLIAATHADLGVQFRHRLRLGGAAA